MLSTVQGGQRAFNRVWIRLTTLGQIPRVFTLNQSYIEQSTF